MSKQVLTDLMNQKDQIQRTIAQLTKEIQLIDKVKNYEKGVVDKQGFPRQDLNFGQLANYRNLKRRKAQLNNDHVKLMKLIELQLFDYHATLPKVETSQQQVKADFSKAKQITTKHQSVKQPQKAVEQKYSIEYLTPFAKISLVEANSPAQIGGLRPNDLLSQFSQINIYTPDNIKIIPHSVKQSKPIKIAVMRPLEQGNQQKYEKVFVLKDKNQYAKIQLSIIPQRWSGRGLLGCKIDPL